MLRTADHATGLSLEPAPDLHALAACAIAYIGTPPTPSAQSLWQCEIDLLHRAGHEVAVLTSRMLASIGNQALPLEASFVMIADPQAALACRPIRSLTQCGLRFAAAWPEGAIEALFEGWPLRLTILPGDADERRTLAARHPEAWMSVADWPAVIDPASLYRQLPGLLSAPARTAPAAAGKATKRKRGGATAASPDPCLRVAVYPGSDAARLRDAVIQALDRAGLSHEGLSLVPVLAADSRTLRGSESDVLLQCHDRERDQTMAALAAIDAGVLPVCAGPAQTTLPIALNIEEEALPLRLFALARDRRRLRQHYLQVMSRALEHFGAEAFFARFQAGLFGSLPNVIVATANSARPPRRLVADLAVIGDFSRACETIEQLLGELRLLAARGQRLVLCPIAFPSGQPVLGRGVEMLVREGIVTLAAAWETVRVTAARIIEPSRTIPALDALRLPIETTHFAVVELQASALPYDPADLHLLLQRLYRRPVTWHAAEPATRRRLAGAVPTDGAFWRPLADPQPRSPAMGRFVIGIVAYASVDSRRTLTALAPIAARRNVDLRLLQIGPEQGSGLQDIVAHDRLAIDGTDLASFCARLDVLAVMAPESSENLPFQAVAQALSSHIHVLADPALAGRLGKGVCYRDSAHWPKELRQLMRDRTRRPVDPAASQRAAARHIGRLGLERRKPAPRRSRKRVLFITANGVGLGHITRLAAIARRLPDDFEAVFASMSQAVGILEPMGFHAELLTTYNGKEGGPWNAATAARLDHILDHHAPDILVLDASNPYPGVMQAAVARRGMKLVWIRRGMWRASQSNDEFLTRAACFDLIIEPGDIAADFDGTRGRLTAGGCLKLPPIGLLDERELLDRETARQALGLDPEERRTSVLVQLGSGTTRDLNRLLNRVFETLSAIDGLEIVLAQWLNATSESRGVWPGVKILQGYPIPLYYRAFDFTISAAGYNSFNDLLRFGVPTIFIANDAQIMDDQGARARYAQEAQAAFDINEFELEPLGDCVAAIMQPNVREYLAQRARKLARPNGAGRAARAIAGLLEPGGGRDVAGGRH